MKKYLLFTILSLIIFTSEIHSQSSGWINLTKNEPYNFLTQNPALDELGNYWILTGYEFIQLAQYDGIEWSYYTDSTKKLIDYFKDSDNMVTFLIDRKNVKWIGTRLGLICFDGEKWTTLNKDNSALPDNYILSMAVDKNDALWICTIGGIAKYDGNTWTLFNQSNTLVQDNPSCIVVDSANVKWFGFSDWNSRKMISYNDSIWTIHTGEYFRGIRALTSDESGNLWFSPGGSTLVKFDGNNCIEYQLQNYGLAVGDINCIAIDKNGIIWIGTMTLAGGGMSIWCWGDGLIRFDGTNIRVFNTSNSGIPSDIVSSIIYHKKGFLWIGTINWESFTSNVSILQIASITNLEVNEIEHNNLPTDVLLTQNYPNPFNPTTTIKYQVQASGSVSLIVFDAIGREVTTLVNEMKEAGYYSATFDGSEHSSGVYFAQLRSGGKVQLRKMLMLK